MRHAASVIAVLSNIVEMSRLRADAFRAAGRKPHCACHLEEMTRY